MGSPRIDRLDRNHIINGNFDYWQRATSQTTAAGLVYGSVDRWRPSFGLGAGAGTFSQSANVPNAYSRFSLRYQTTTAQASLGTGDSLRIIQFIEGLMLKPLVGRAVTLSFYFRTNKAGTYSVAIQNVAATRTYVTQFVVSSSEASGQTWVKRTVYLTLESAGWAVDTARGMTVIFSLADNSTANLSPSVNTWAAGSYTWAAGQTNIMDTVGNFVEISQVCLYEGTIVDPEYSLAGKNIFEELRLCQRYFQTLENIPGVASQTNRITGFCPLPVHMRATPTAGMTGALNFQGTTSFNLTQTVQGYSNIAGITAKGFYAEFANVPAGPSNGFAFVCAVPSNNGNYVTLDAEL